DIGETSSLGHLAAFSTNPLPQKLERIEHNVHELAGPWYLAVVPHGASAIGQPFLLEASVVAPDEPLPIDDTAVPAFPPPEPPDPAVKTLILFNDSRLSMTFPGVGLAELTGRLALLAAEPDVAGIVVNLDDYGPVNAAYAAWDAQPDNPQSANLVARTIKSLLYSHLLAYPNVENIVLVGGDSIIPHRRVADLTLVANERRYLYYDTPAMQAAGRYRYYLSDDYYAASLPVTVDGRELYIPQYALGRLVETPEQIVAVI